MNTAIPSDREISDLVSPDPTARILGVKPGTLAVWRSVGRYDLPFVKVGRKVMYRPADIEAFIERRLRNQTD